MLRFLHGRQRKAALILFDMCCFAAADLLYFLLAMEAAYSTPVGESHEIANFLWCSAILFVSIFVGRFIGNTYRTIWRYTSTKAYFDMVLADIIGAAVTLVIARFTGVYNGVWHVATVTMMTALAALFARFAYRLIYKRRNRRNSVSTQRTRVAICGAGQLGQYLANDLFGNPNSGSRPLFFIDTDSTKVGSFVAGLRVYDEEEGTRRLEKYDVAEVIIAIKSLDSEKISRLYYRYASRGCRVKVFDSLVQAEGNVQKAVIREFSIEDLLFRKPIDINNQTVFDYYKGKTVLVTGGGGSIGSELCRQIAACNPRRLIIFDIYENNAYDIQQELISHFGDKLDLAVEIGSVRDEGRLDMVFAHYRPQVVFHAAAHKHVPLMEHSAAEAIKNNVMGTYYTANAAEKYGVEKFILISTDKAVNPTNIMGASKRLCEMIVQSRTDSKTSFAAVRFGNVLGSNGSVIPLFKRQIAEGGPVTITDRRIIRFFMTIGEASQLVLQSGAMAKRGELFVLDMGKPVNIYDLAVSMIRLSGYEPDKDIRIEEIGLRPGEKLYEELLMQSETLDKTENNMIFIERDAPLSREEIEEKLRILNEAVDRTDTVGAPYVRDAVAAVVPTYRDPDVVNSAVAI